MLKIKDSVDLKELKEKHYIITGGRSAGKTITQKALQYDLLKKELEVCKRALEMACKWIDSASWSITDGTDEDWERAKQSTVNFYLDQSRKELEDERKTN